MKRVKSKSNSPENIVGYGDLAEAIELASKGE